MKKLLEKLEKKDSARAAEFKKIAQPAVKKILDTFKDWDFFTGERMNPDGMVALLNYREDGVTPYMLFFRDGLVEMKVVSVYSCSSFLLLTACSFLCSDAPFIRRLLLFIM